MKKNELDSLEKIEKTGDKINEVIASIGMSTAFTSLASLIIQTPDNMSLKFLTGGTILLSPIVYFGMKTFKKKADDRMERDMHHTGQIMLMLKEGSSADHNITKSTTLFLHELLQEQKNYDVEINDDEKMNINQFIYLINANYYDEIKKTFPTLNREEIVRRIITIILEYMKENNKNTFDEKDAKIIVERCLFIKPELKEQISKEFAKSKVKFGKKKFYEIIRKDVDSSIASYTELRREDETKQAPNFDIESMKDLHILIQGYSDEERIKEFGNTMIDWDYDFLIKVLTLVSIKYRRQLVEEYGEYHNNLNLAASFIFYALTYAVVNKREQVGYKEMINAFKNWDYVPFKLQLEILDDLFEQENIPYEEHPYKLNKKRKNSQKIIHIDFTKK